MREYFHYLYVPFPNKLLLDSNRLRKFKEKNKISAISSLSLTYGWTSNVMLNGTYIYKENGVYYEFFSGYRLGVDGEKIGCDIPMLGEGFCPVIYSNDSDVQCLARLSASQFSFDIQKYMKYQKPLAKILNELLNLYHEEWVIKQNNAAATIKSEEKRNTNDSKWLEDFLNNR